MNCPSYHIRAGTLTPWTVTVALHAVRPPEKGVSTFDMERAYKLLTSTLRDYVETGLWNAEATAFG